MKVYVVVTDSIEQWHTYEHHFSCVRRVFLNKEKAQRYLDWLFVDGEEKWIEEHEISDDDAFCNDIIKKKIICSSITYDKKQYDIDFEYIYNDYECIDLGMKSIDEVDNIHYCKLYGRKRQITIFGTIDDNKYGKKTKIKEDLVHLRSVAIELESAGYSEEEINEIINNKED